MKIGIGENQETNSPITYDHQKQTPVWIHQRTKQCEGSNPHVQQAYLYELPHIANGEIEPHYSFHQDLS